MLSINFRARQGSHLHTTTTHGATGQFQSVKVCQISVHADADTAMSVRLMIITVLSTTVCCLQVLVPTSQFIRSLVAARLAADVLDVPTVLIARTDAHSAALLTSDVDEVDRAFCTGERTPEGFYRVKEGVKVSNLC